MERLKVFGWAFVAYAVVTREKKAVMTLYLDLGLQVKELLSLWRNKTCLILFLP